MDDLAALRAKFPSWSFWQGAATREFWAAPPPGFPDQELICAPDVAALEALVISAEARKPLA
jgi:hypothetical protein